jgi:hypothetical protein
VAEMAFRNPRIISDSSHISSGGVNGTDQQYDLDFGETSWAAREGLSEQPEVVGQGVDRGREADTVVCLALECCLHNAEAIEFGRLVSRLDVSSWSSYYDQLVRPRPFHVMKTSVWSSDILIPKRK